MPSIDEIISSVARNGGNKTKAAEELGMPRTTLRRKLDSCTRTEGSRVTGRSTLVDLRTNEPVLEWVKTSVTAHQEDLAREAAFQALTDKLPRYPQVKGPQNKILDLMSCYILTDYHLGMLAWSEETGSDDWDLKIAEEMLVGWFKAATKSAPDSECAVFANMGDFLHWDGMDAITPAHGNLLDADTRFQKLVRCAIRVQRQIIDMLLAKHRHVHLIYADANHDPASGAWMREWMDAVYENEAGITVETSADSFYCVEHGQTMVTFHHGHKRGIKDVDRVMAAKFSEAFGRAKYRYAHLGHLHSDHVLETPLMKIERHRTLAAPDAYAAKGGWISGRDAKVITYSKRFGEVSRIVINPEMVMYG